MAPDPSVREGEPIDAAAIPLRIAEGPTAWTGRDMAGRGDWIHHLDDAAIAELEAAADAAAGRDIATLERGDLPRLDAALAVLAREVVEGRGFVLIRGLPVERWGLERSAIAFWTIGLRFGVPVPQNAQGHLLGHVRDLGNDPNDPMVRVYTTRGRQEYHTDSCDIVGLLCLRPARFGGASSIVSSTTLYNEMVRRRPDLARVLMEPLTVDRKGEVPEGKGPTYRLPVFHDHAGRITTIYARSFIEAAQTRPEVPRLTPAQREALDLLDSLAESDELRLDMDFRPGDAQLLHNHQILHARTAYQDWPEPERKRHLLRLWLAAHRARPLPDSFAERYGPLHGPGARGGIRVPGAVPHVRLEP